MAFENTSNAQYSGFIALSRYARWKPEENRRETWEETVGRYVGYWVNKFPDILTEPLNGGTTLEEELYHSILQLDNMPSMRALMTA